MTKSIQHTFFYQHPPKDVWEYLTNSELVAQWLMPNDFEPITGYNFQFKINPISKLDFEGIIYGKFLGILPHKIRPYSWKSSPSQGKIAVDFIVIWTLTPKDKSTELKLVYSDFREIEDFNMYSTVDDDWFKNIKKIDNLLNARSDDTTNV